MCAVLMFYFFRTGCFEVLYSQLWNVLHFYVPDGSRFFKCNKNRCFFWSFHNLRKGILFFILLFCFKQCVRLGLSCLLGLNTVIILPLYCNAIIVWSLEMFCVVSQAFISMLAKRGTVFVRGCIGYHFVNSTLSCPTPFSSVYCYVINQRGRWLWLSRGGM